MKPKLLRYLIAGHRWLGLLVSLVVLLWTLTGVLHPIMSATQPQPVKKMPPPQTLDLRQAYPLPTLLRERSITTVQQVAVVQWAGQSAYRIATAASGEARYFDSRTGVEIAGGEREYVRGLAVWYSGQSDDQITAVSPVSQFDDDYPSVNRLLPVWQVSFKDGLRAYVDPAQSRLATLSNDPKMWMARLFRLGHTWDFGSGAWVGQQLLMSLFLVMALSVGIGGVVLFVVLRNRQGKRLATQPLARWHRRLGLGVSVFLLLWAGSGLFHVVHHASPPQRYPATDIAVGSLSDGGWQQAVAAPLSRLDLVPIAGSGPTVQVGWLIRPLGAVITGSMTAPPQGEHHHGAMHAPPPPSITLLDSQTGQPLPDGVTLQARNLAQMYSGLGPAQMAEVSWVTSFGGEYGFINKRLPVLKVTTRTPDHLRLYIEPATGALAAQVSDLDALEGWSFAYLHKWNFLPVAKTVRDVLMATTALLIAALVIMGLSVWVSRRRRTL